MIKNFIFRYKLELIGVALGAIAGWAYWYYAGCMSGTCMITSRPLNSTLYGALIGMLLLSVFKKEKKPENSGSN